MKKSDLIGWDWKFERGEMVVFPTTLAYAKYALTLVFGPVLVLICLTIAGATPWGILNPQTTGKHSNPLIDEAHREKLELSRQRAIDNFREVLDEETIERMLTETASAAQERTIQRQEAAGRITLVGFAIASVLGLLWLSMIGIGALFLAALIRLPTATYRFSRTKGGDLLFRIPHLFRTIEYRIPATAINECAIGKDTKWVGKFGMRVLIWFVALRPNPGKQIELPLFVIADQLPKDSTGRPPERVVEFSKALQRIYRA